MSIFFKDSSIKGALACGDIWDTLVVSFNSSIDLETPFIEIIKESLEGRQTIRIKHASRQEHLKKHADFFMQIEASIQENITPSNFWAKKEALFKQKIIFSKDVEKQIKTIDVRIFKQALSILRAIEKGNKRLQDFTTSGESQSVKQDENLKKLRMFEMANEKVYFEHHIKSLSNGYRIYYRQENEKIYIGYIGKHLRTKNFD